MQVAILAVADAVIGKDALTSVIAEPTVLSQVALNTVVLSLVAAAVISGDHAVFGIGIWSAILLVSYLASLYLVSKSQGRHSWIADKNTGPMRRLKREKNEQQTHEHEPMAKLVAKTAAGAAVILVAGFLLSKTGEAIASQTGFGSCRPSNGRATYRVSRQPRSPQRSWR